MAINTLPSTGTVGDEQTINGVTYILAALNPTRWLPKGGVTLDTTVNNTYQDVTFSATVVDDNAATGNLSVVSKTNDTLSIATSDAGSLTGDFHTTQRARDAITGAAIGLASGSLIDGVAIASTTNVTDAVPTGTKPSEWSDLSKISLFLGQPGQAATVNLTIDGTAATSTGYTPYTTASVAYYFYPSIKLSGTAFVTTGGNLGLWSTSNTAPTSVNSFNLIG